jgi:hypothetical protein
MDADEERRVEAGLEARVWVLWSVFPSVLRVR